MSRLKLLVAAFMMFLSANVPLAIAQNNSTENLRESQKQDSVNNSTQKQLEQEFFSNLILPPIELLFESTQNAPIVQYYKARKMEETYTLKALNMQWADMLKFTAGYQYGRLGTVSTLDNLINPILNEVTTKNQSYYNIGATLIVPLEVFLNSSSKAKAQKERIAQTEHEIQRYYNEQKLLISEAYTTAMKCLNMIKVRSEALNIAEAQYLVSVDEFSQNKITASDLSRMKNIQSAATGDYELTKAELIDAIIRLEILSGYKFIK